MRCSTSLSFGVALACVLAPATAPAAEFTVDSAIDVIPAGDANPGDGICEDERSGVRCTLRAAIEEANALSGTDTIRFAVSGTIAIIGTPLPVMTGRTLIDGKSAPGYVQGASLAASPPVVYLSGTLLADSADGLRFRNANASSSAVIALGLVHFGGTAIATAIGADALEADGNYIGVLADGTAAGNGAGLFLVGDDNQVGRKGPAGSSGGLGNVVSASDGEGITIVGNGNRIRANMVGITATGGAVDRGNGGAGVLVVGDNNLLGDSRAGDGNKVMFNGGDGIRAHGDTNIFKRNGVHSSGLDALGAAGHGIAVFGSGNLVGDLPGAAGNVVRGNALNGVQFGSETLLASNNVLANNSIFENLGHGVQLGDGAGNHVVDNDVYGNGGAGIDLQPGASGARVLNNLVGVRFSLVDGTPVPSGNGSHGIRELGAGNWIGVQEVAGEPVLRPNLVGFNGADGIRAGGAGTRIAGNLVGATSAGEDIGNGDVGIHVEASATSATVDDNLLGFNGTDGLRVSADGTVVCGNLVGTTAAYGDIGNAVYGLRLLADGAVIGGGIDCAPNLIGFNGSDGIAIAGHGNAISNNYIGGEASGSVDIGNHGSGVRIGGAGSSANVVVENSIAANGLDGIRLGATAGTGNLLIFNQYRDNGGTGIDLGADGYSGNDANDVDSGPNRLQNSPEILLADLVGNQLQVGFRVDSSAVDAAYPLRLEFVLADGSGRRQGIRTLGFETYTVPGAVASTTIVLPPDILGGRLLALAHDDADNSSEFSAGLDFGVPDGLFADGFESPP